LATEDDFHVTVAELLDWCLLSTAFYTTFPAGYGKLSKATSGKLKAKGMKAGMPDILVFQRWGHGETTKVIGLELKAGSNSVSAAQRYTHAMLQVVGVRVYVVRSVEEVMAALHQAGISHRTMR
jgi:hypothetical protein